MLHYPRRHGYHLAAPPWGCASGGRGLHHVPSNAVREKPRERDCGFHCYRQTGRHVCSLPPVPQILGAVREDVVHVLPRKQGTVPDGLHSGGGQPSVPESFNPVPSAQPRPLYGSGVPLQSRSMGSHQIPGETLTVPYIPPEIVDLGRLVVFRPAEGYSQTVLHRETVECVYFGGYMEAIL